MSQKGILICEDYKGLKKGFIYEARYEKPDLCYLKIENSDEEEIVITENILNSIAIDFNANIGFYVYEYDINKGIKKLFQKYKIGYYVITNDDYVIDDLELRKDVFLNIEYPIRKLNKSYELRVEISECNKEKLDTYVNIQSIVNKLIDETIDVIYGANKEKIKDIRENLPNVRLAIESLYYKELDMDLTNDKNKANFDYAKSIIGLL